MASREETLNYAKSLACLPVMDGVIQRVSEILDEKKLSFSHLFECVRYDPALSSKLIANANSAWHNRGVPVVTLKRAMTVLGLEEVKSLLVCTLFYDGVLKKLGLRKRDVFHLWEHSLLVAFTASALCGEERQVREKAFTAGLLHDMGKAPLQLLYQYEIFDEKVDQDAVCADERERFDTDHQEVGFYMAVEWCLPEEYRQAIRLHHESAGGERLAELIRDANRLIHRKTDDPSAFALKQTAKEKTRQIMDLFAVMPD